MSEIFYMREASKHCPFRRDVRPFLRPERAEDIAYSTQNPYSEFHCHKTIEHDDEGDGYATDKSLICAGFLAMQINEGAVDAPKGYVWPDGVYSDAYEMTGAYEDAANGEWRP